MGDLYAEMGSPELAAALADLETRGHLVADSRPSRGARYVQGVELVPGDREGRLERVGRSLPGRRVVEVLEALGRPATVDEVVEAATCGRGVVRRLVGLGLLRTFTQVERHSLERHRLRGADVERIRLRPDQQSAVTALDTALQEGGFRAFLLIGMTGAGKTEVYLRAVETTLAAGRGAILLVPEIALVPALAQEASRRFGTGLALLHSSLSATERQQEWERIRSGEARVVLGPRSAVFAPVERLGLLVVDEEQDPSYKQDGVPRYNGRDLAMVRARQQAAAVVLVSATPSLESRHNATVGKLRQLSLTERVGQGALPEGILVDLRREPASRRRPGEVIFSARLRSEIESALAADEQIILLRNRRGYAPILLCRACGEDSRCDACGVPRTLHRRDAALICHYCGSRHPVPERCSRCDEPALEPVGAGTERVEEQFREFFPGVQIDVLDRDTARRPGGAAAVLQQFASGSTRVLLGTQMVSKGHHFPEVALTGVLLADTYLSFPDFRAVERTYSMLTQLAGRAGRGERPGRVVIQTFFPDHYAIQAVLGHDDARFAAEELRYRRVFHYPPYTRMVQLLASHPDRERARACLEATARAIAEHPSSRQVRVAGPAPAPLERLRGRWRFQMLLRSAHGGLLRRLVQEVIQGGAGQAELTVDVDPYQLL